MKQGNALIRNLIFTMVYTLEKKETRAYDMFYDIEIIEYKPDKDIKTVLYNNKC